MKITFIGLTITSSWGNGHATTYRALLRALGARGHTVHFLEHDKPWYSKDRDHTSSPFYTISLYSSIEELQHKHQELIAGSDLVVLGSYVPQAKELAPWLRRQAKGVFAFYDIDTPVTIQGLRNAGIEYLEKQMIPQFDLFLSFSGGETLRVLEEDFGARRARALYCSVDPEAYYPENGAKEWSLGYLGTYSDDRRATVEEFLVAPARRLKDMKFVVAGPGHKGKESWPANVRTIEHLPPAEHRSFYARQRITLNVTRAPMIELGHSPSVRLFEASACGTPILSDHWKGSNELFAEGEEILIARSGSEALEMLATIPDQELIAIGERARNKVLKYHTAAQRAVELEEYYEETNMGHLALTRRS